MQQSNVRGPDQPLYLAGARMVAFAPVSIAVNGLGLNVTGFSYAGTMWVCAVACRDMMPDPAFFAQCLRNAFAALVAAADALPAPDVSREREPRPRVAPRKRSAKTRRGTLSGTQRAASDREQRK